MLRGSVVPEWAATTAPVVQNAMDKLASFNGEESPKHSKLGFGVSEVKHEAPEAEQYVHVGGRALVGLYLSVWIRKPLLQHTSAWQVRRYLAHVSMHATRTCMPGPSWRARASACFVHLTPLKARLIVH
jgi:hypothetical protein